MSANSKIIISSIQQFAALATNTPSILNLRAFMQLRDIIAKASQPSGGCKCKKGADLASYRPQFETAFALLSPDEQVQLKTLLNISELCYYRRDDKGQINQACF